MSPRAGEARRLEIVPMPRVIARSDAARQPARTPTTRPNGAERRPPPARWPGLSGLGRVVASTMRTRSRTPRAWPGSRSASLWAAAPAAAEPFRRARVRPRRRGNRRRRSRGRACAPRDPQGDGGTRPVGSRNSNAEDPTCRLPRQVFAAVAARWSRLSPPAWVARAARCHSRGNCISTVSPFGSSTNSWSTSSSGSFNSL